VLFRLNVCVCAVSTLRNVCVCCSYWIAIFAPSLHLSRSALSQEHQHKFRSDMVSFVKVYNLAFCCFVKRCLLLGIGMEIGSNGPDVEPCFFNRHRAQGHGS